MPTPTLPDTDPQITTTTTTPVSIPDPNAIPTGESDKELNFARLRKIRDDLEVRNKEQASELAKYQETERKTKEKKMEEEGKYKELLDQKESQIEKLKTEQTNALKSNIVRESLRKAGIHEDAFEFAIPKLLSEITFNDQGEATNLDDKINTMKVNQAFFFSDPKPVVAGKFGSGITSNIPSSTLTPEQARNILESGDARLYEQHREEILALRQE